MNCWLGSNFVVREVVINPEKKIGFKQLSFNYNADTRYAGSYFLF